MEFLTEMKRAAELAKLNLSPRQLTMFAEYYEMLREGNERINLTALTEPQDVAIKHFVDSLMAYDENIFKNGKNVVDIGSGAGFPGLPLKIYDEELCVTLMDSLGKRVHFLENVVEELKLNDVKYVCARAEDAARDEKMREKYDVAVSRAVAPLNVLSEYVLPFVKIGGKMIALKGKKGYEEVAAATNAIKMLGGGEVTSREVKLPIINDIRIVVTINKESTTLQKFPRRAGIPSKKPL